MASLTIFTWGYDGWGSSTRQLKAAMDAVEAGHGFDAPYFVDLRISRSVRAEGFRDHAFEKIVGKARYQWMPSLGNNRIKRRKGPRVQIKEPAAVEELLGIALRRNANRQRVVMFCSCALPGRPGAHDRCHRVDVASLLLKAAAKRNVSLSIGEWPGGQPQARTLEVSDLQAAKLNSGVRNIVLGKRQPPVELLRLPWGSIVDLRSPCGSGRVIADPAVYRGGKWLLPVPFGVAAPGADLRALKKKSLRERRLSGLNIRGTS